MSGLVPPDGRKWSGTSTARLLKLTRESHLAPLQAIIRGREGDKVAVWLIGNDGEGVNELLVDEGLAKYGARKILKFPFCFRFLTQK